ncbi:hypothetical protein FRC03_006930, partial [Tulasnella sp. 419]
MAPSYHCGRCSAIFDSWDGLQQHSASTHTGPVSSYNFRERLHPEYPRAQSQSSASSTVRIACRLCNRGFPSAIDLYSHTLSGECRSSSSSLVSVSSTRRAAAPPTTTRLSSPPAFISQHLQATTSQTSDRR